MNRGLDAQQFIATARARASEQLARKFGAPPYTRDEMRLPVTLTFEYPARLTSGPRPIVSAAKMHTIREARLPNREVSFNMLGQGEVSISYVCVNPAAPPIEVHRKLSDDVGSVVNEVVQFLSGGDAPQA